MSVTLRPARGGKGYEYSIIFTWPEGGWFRERKKAPIGSKDAALRWAQARERALLTAGKAAHENDNATDATPTLSEFWPRFVRDHYEANRKKPSTIEAARTIYRVHLEPKLGSKRLNAITSSDIAALKGALAESAPKTVNNVLSVLSRAINAAIDWGVLTHPPCKIGLLPVASSARDWYELAEYRRLIDAAEKIGTSTLTLVLLAGSAGLRRGEIIALKWSDLDLERRLVRVERGIWQGHEETPKGGRSRIVPMTPELFAALRAHRPQTGLLERVLYSERGEDLSNRVIRNWLRTAQRRAGLPLAGRAKLEKDRGGAIHMLRHTFCSHLALAGVPARAIQELAGHADLTTTQRYMHLSPANRGAAIGTLSAFYATSDRAHEVSPIDAQKAASSV